MFVLLCIHVSIIWYVITLYSNYLVGLSMIKLFYLSCFMGIVL